MPKDSIFELTGKFGFKPKFGNWVEEDFKQREEKEQVTSAKFIISSSMSEAAYWSEIWSAIQKVSYFKNIQAAMSKDKDFDIYLVRAPHIYYGGETLLRKDGRYVSTNTGIPLGSTIIIRTALEFDNLKNGYHRNKKEGDITGYDKPLKHEKSFWDKKEVAASFNAKKQLLVVSVYNIVSPVDFTYVLSKLLKITKEDYIISAAETTLHELYAHIINLLNDIEKRQEDEHLLYHGGGDSYSPSLKEIEKYTGKDQKLPAYIILKELQEIVYGRNK